jgi:anti-sigma factor RsiW
VPECCPAEAVVAAYVNHTATSEERRRVEAHLTECDDCGELVAFLVRWSDKESEGSGDASAMKPVSPAASSMNFSKHKKSKKSLPT